MSNRKDTKTIGRCYFYKAEREGIFIQCKSKNPRIGDYFHHKALRVDNEKMKIEMRYFGCGGTFKNNFMVNYFLTKSKMLNVE